VINNIELSADFEILKLVFKTIYIEIFAKLSIYSELSVKHDTLVNIL
jgi:hypothetical protein